MAQLPSGPGPVLIRFRGRARPPGKGVTAPISPPPGKAVTSAPPPPPPPPPQKPQKPPRSALYRYLAANTAALSVAGGGEATGDALAEIATASDAQAAANGRIATAIENITSALGKPVTLGAEDRAALKAIGDRLNEMKTAVSSPVKLGEDERKIFTDVVEKLGQVATAIESDRSEPSIGAAAMLTIAIGAQGHISQAREGRWLGAANFETLTDIASVTAEDFADRMLSAREGEKDLLLSELVANATRSDLLFMHDAAQVALEAIPKKSKKPSNP